MKANELRIGNLLEYPMFGMAAIRDGQDIDDVIENSGSAIPLSEEILLNCGFELMVKI